MATVGHLAAGFALGRAGNARHSWLGPLVIAVAAVAPDVDFLLGVNHRGPTHSIGFAALVGAGVYAMVRLSPMDGARRLGVLAFLAVGTHIVLDLLTAHSPVAVLWPILRREFVLPVVLLPSAPVGDAIASWRGLAALAAEVAWSLGLIALAERSRRRLD